MKKVLVISPLVADAFQAPVVNPQGYSDNPICHQHRCVNPIFPGLQDLPNLESDSWQCSQRPAVEAQLRFCYGAVQYDVALPQSDEASVGALVQQQENVAIMAFRYHLAALNLDAWEYQSPNETDDACVRSIWRLACETYLPKSQQNCQVGASTPFLRPCRTSCETYISACGVQCCDESVRCVFHHPAAEDSTADKTKNASELVGYYDADAPSAYCTGSSDSNGAPRSSTQGAWAVTALTLLSALSTFGPETQQRQQGTQQDKQQQHNKQQRTPRGFGRVAILAVLAISSVSLHGCNIAGHATAEWQLKPSYLANFQYVPTKLSVPSGDTEAWQLPLSQAVMNSCEVVGLKKDEECSGNGVCRPWNMTTAASNPRIPALTFCQCYRDWADPQCRTRRKSQAKAYWLSLFTGFLGLDRFYLGQFWTGILKLGTVGGLGFWWLWDIVYIGSAPVYANEFRLAADLPHWLFVGSATGAAIVAGVVLLNLGGSELTRRRQRTLLMMEQEAEFFRTRSAALGLGLKDKSSLNANTMHAYGSF
mmetsp:Transcript_82943/g.173666  ORF Transcript_82943/g.173666 Transcript_82943/m.173666 type:complete len:537 (-) Transcript_82943:30-1640(-)